jgi:hypothetical protein
MCKRTEFGIAFVVGWFHRFSEERTSKGGKRLDAEDPGLLAMMLLTATLMNGQLT